MFQELSNFSRVIAPSKFSIFPLSPLMCILRQLGDKAQVSLQPLIDSFASLGQFVLSHILEQVSQGTLLEKFEVFLTPEV